MTPAHQHSTTKPAQCGLCRIWPSHPAPSAKSPPPTHLNAHADDAHPESAHDYAASAYAHADGCAAPFHPIQPRACADGARRVCGDDRARAVRADAHGHGFPSGESIPRRPLTRQRAGTSAILTRPVAESR